MMAEQEKLLVPQSFLRHDHQMKIFVFLRSNIVQIELSLFETWTSQNSQKTLFPWPIKPYLTSGGRKNLQTLGQTQADPARGMIK